MKFRVCELKEIVNVLHDTTTKEGRLEPEFLYQVHLLLVKEGIGPKSGELILNFKYVPMLEIGSTYSLNELENL